MAMTNDELLEEIKPFINSIFDGFEKRLASRLDKIAQKHQITMITSEVQK